MKFTIDDRPAVFGRLAPSLQKLHDILAALPDGKLVTAPQLSALAGISFGTMMRQGCLVDRSLSVQHGNKKFYGNKKTIQAYKAAYHL